MIINTRVKKQSGFGLLEIVISLFMISFSVISLTVLQTNIVRQSRLAQDKLVALYIAESILEQFRVTGEGVDVGIDPKFQVNLLLSPHSEIDNLTVAEVVVDWRDITGIQHSVELHSAFSPR